MDDVETAMRDNTGRMSKTEVLGRQRMAAETQLPCLHHMAVHAELFPELSSKMYGLGSRCKSYLITESGQSIPHFKMTEDATLDREQLEIECAFNEPKERDGSDGHRAADDDETLVRPRMPEDVGQGKKRRDNR